MKKFLTVIFLTALLILSSCSNSKNTFYSTDIKYVYSEGLNDGEYTGYGNTSYFETEKVTLVIKNGFISSVYFYMTNKNGDIITLSERKIDDTDLDALGKVLANRIVYTQSYDVQNVENIEEQCESWKLAVKRALDKAAV